MIGLLKTRHTFGSKLVSSRCEEGTLLDKVIHSGRKTVLIFYSETIKLFAGGSSQSSLWEGVVEYDERGPHLGRHQGFLEAGALRPHPPTPKMGLIQDAISQTPLPADPLGPDV